MIRKIEILIVLFFIVILNSFAKSSSTSISNISSYKLKGGEVIYNSNTVFANLKLVKLVTRITNDKKYIKSGEITRLKVTLKNLYEYEAENLEMSIILPRGFSYIDDSERITKNKIDKVVVKNEKVNFYLNKPLKKDEELEVFLSVKVNIMANTGDNFFSTKSMGKIKTGGDVVSNKDTGKIIVEKEKIQQKGVIIGKVFIDLNNNMMFDRGEPTVPNVKIYLENGHFAITDINGKYSLFGEKAVAHIVRLDSSSAPLNGKLVKIDNRYSDIGDMAVIELIKNQLNKVNFAFSNTDDSFIKDINERKALIKKIPTEIEEVIQKNELTFSNVTAGDTIEAKGSFSDGMNQLSEAIEKFEKEKQVRLLEKYLKQKKKITKVKPDLKKILKKLNNSLDFLDLKQNQIVSEVISIKFKAPLNSENTLYINNKKISKDFLGISAISPENNLSFYQYDGIKLKSEKNIVEIQSIFKGKVTMKKIVLIYPSNISKIDLNYNKDELVADFTKPIKLKISLKNNEDFLIKTPYFISIENTAGTFILPEDISNDLGLQFIIENGEQILEFLPPPKAEIVEFKIKVNGVVNTFSLDFKPKKKPMLITGVVEGRIDLKQNNFNLFKDDLSGKQLNKDNDFSYRTAVFATGDLNEKYNLTISYDNTKDDDDAFFQNIKRDNYYLVFGDNSIKGYEAQSKSHLYLLLENSTTKYLYGDYSIDWSSDEVDIGNYSRTLTGYRFNYDNKKFKFQTFLSDTKNIQVIEKMNGKNISGPYYLKNSNILENSEKIDIIVYDKNNPAIQLIEVQAPNYTLDYYTGVIYFDTIIPEFDKNGNPISIRVNYEVEESFGKKYPIYGAITTYKINKIISIGGTFVKNEHETEKYENTSVNLVLNGDELGKITFETGQTKSDENTGNATLIKYINENNNKFTSKIIYYDSDEGFSAPNSTVENNSRLFSINSLYRITKIGEIDVEGFIYKDKTKNETLNEMSIKYKINISELSSLELGSKYSNPQLQPSNEELITAGAKYDWKFFKIPKMNNYLEYEQDIRNSDNKRISFGSEYKHSEFLKFYGKYNIINEIEDTYIINRYNDSYSKLIGTEFGSSKYIKPYLEYREHSNDEKNKEIAIGFRSDYTYNKYLSISSILERVEGIDSNKMPNETNLILSYLYKNGNDNISTSSIDITENNEIISLLFKGNYGKKFENDLTLAIKNRYFIENIKKNKVRNRFLTGLAYRDLNDIYNSLVKYEIVYDEQLENEDYIHLSHILNTTQNYQINKNNILTLSFGGKYVVDKNSDISESYFSYLAGANWKYFVTRKIDLGINSAVTFDDDSNNIYGFGIEIGYKPNDYVLLSLGYNFVGFEDRDFYYDDRFRKGLYLKFKLILHENIFSQF